jgi:hypothetical protein
LVLRGRQLVDNQADSLLLLLQVVTSPHPIFPNQKCSDVLRS